MCELFYLKSGDNGYISREKLHGLVQAAQNGSLSNNDGSGAFNRNGRIFRTDKAMHDMDTHEVVNMLYGSREIVLHVRASTRGSVCSENAHPFTEEGRVLAHNGTIHGVRDYSDGDTVDSHAFLKKVVDSDADSESKAIKESLEDTRGWLSIFYRETYDSDKPTYYFRDSASFTFGRTESGDILGATSGKRFSTYTEVSGDAISSRKTPEEGVIYRITDAGIMEDSEFDTDERTISSSNTSTRRSYYGHHPHSRFSSDYSNQESEKSDYEKYKARNKGREYDYSDESEESESHEEWDDPDYEGIEGVEWV